LADKKNPWKRFSIINCFYHWESDCIFKTKQTDRVVDFFTVCDFCSVLWMSKWRNSNKRESTAGV